MNQNLAEIAFILDRSGWMSSFQKQAISSFNRFLAEQSLSPATHAGQPQNSSGTPDPHPPQHEAEPIIPISMPATFDGIFKTAQDQFLAEGVSPLAEHSRRFQTPRFMQHSFARNFLNTPNT